MKFTAILAFIAAATVVSASTNAERLARGLPPNAPVKRGSPVVAARRGQPSGTPSQCNTGSVHCCNSVQTAHSGDTCDSLLGLFGILGEVEPGTSVGVTCSPISVIGAGGNSCTQQTVCCENNNFNGVINIGCSPITINL